MQLVIDSDGRRVAKKVANWVLTMAERWVVSMAKGWASRKDRTLVAKKGEMAGYWVDVKDVKLVAEMVDKLVFLMGICLAG